MQSVCAVSTLFGSASEQLSDATELQEAAIAICINGISQAVMMATPRDLEAFARGFAISEGLIANANDILDVEVEPIPDGWQADIWVLAAAEHQLKARRRLMAGPSGCGLCGTDSVSAAITLPEVTQSTACVPDESAIRMAVQQLPEIQKQQGCIRGHHGAAFFDLHGCCIALAEDVGRHSALDKLIGRLLSRPLNKQQSGHKSLIGLSGLSGQSSLPGLPGFAVITSRCSHDLIQKSARSGLSNLVTLSPPTDLAVKSARQCGLKLFCFKRGELHRFA